MSSPASRALWRRLVSPLLRVLSSTGHRDLTTPGSGNEQVMADGVIAGRDEIVRLFLERTAFRNVLDIGCGQGTIWSLLEDRSVAITGVDILSPGDVLSRWSGPQFRYVEADFMRWDTPEVFDAIICSHVVEHVANTEAFLIKLFSHLRVGGFYCIIWPPPKPEIVGGHVHVFNFGLLLYNLVRIGIDCRAVSLVESGYSLGVLGQLSRFELPPLKHDKGDIEVLARYFPFPVTQGFDGDSPPGVQCITRLDAGDR